MSIIVAKKWWLSIIVTVVFLSIVWVVGAVMAQEPEPSSLTAPSGDSPTWTFTYQGQLNDNGQPADGYYDFSISIWNTSTLGTQVGDTYVYDDPGVLVEDGIFSINVPPGARDEVFNGEARWIQVEVRPHGSGSYTTLSRQPITGVPYAWGLRPGAVISGTAAPSSPIFSAQATGGPAISGYSADGTGVYGTTDGTTADDYGVHGAGQNGIGVAGISVNRSGVYGSTEGTRDDGAGVHGYASDGNGVGVYGQVSTPSSHSPFPDGAAVWGSSANELGVLGSSDTLVGVHGVSVDSYGVRGSSTNSNGVYGESSNGYGVLGVGNAFGGVHGSSTDGNGVQGISTNGYGVYGIGGTMPGVYGSSTYTNGVYGATNGTTIAESGVFGIASGEANGVHGYQSNSPSGLGVFGEHVGGGAAVSGYNQGTGNGVWGYSEDYRGVGAGTALADGNYGFHTYDNLYSANYHKIGAVMQVVQNGDTKSLERGDTVVISGLSTVTVGDTPILEVTSAREANSTAVLGVVASTYSAEWLVDTASIDPTGATGLPDEIPLSSPGPIAPGEYLLVVVQGPCQVKVDATSAAIQPGDLLSTAGRIGYAAKAESVDVEGVQFVPPGIVFGKALEPLDAGRDGLIYVFVTLE